MDKKRLVRTSTICLVISFIIITVISMHTINNVINRENTSMVTLIATNIYEDINTDLQEEISIGRTMANDSGMIEVLKNEDKYTQEECEKIFSEIMGNYVRNLDCDTAFVVSDKSRRYYTQKGFNKTVDTANDAHDIWYSDFLAEGKDYSFNIDNDETHENTWTVFINVRVYDNAGTFLGVCGIGTVIKDMQTVITDMQKMYEVKVSVIDKYGYIQMDTDDDRIDQRILDEIKVNYSNSEISYTKVSDGYVVTKYMPEFGWTLVIQRHIDTTAIMLKLIAKNMMVMVGVIVLLLLGSTYFIEKDTEKLAEDFQLDNYSNLVAIYEAVYIIDIKKDRGREIKSLFDSKFNLLRDKGTASEQMKAITQNWVPKAYQKSILEFVDLNTLPERIHGKRSIAEEFKIIRLGDREEWSRAIFIAVGDPNKEAEQVLFALENIDDEKRKSEALVHEIETAKAASEAKGRFLANMSHEIRTPINAVLGMNTMILRECDDPLVRKHAMNIHNAGNTLLSLVNDILDISKIESGKMGIVPVEYSLASLIVDVVNMVSFKAEAKGLALKCDVDETLPSMLFGDDVRIRQIIMNLMNNAVKYTEKGEVILSVKSVKADKKVIIANTNNGSVGDGEKTECDETVELEISVKDTGVGIKPEDMEKLYEDFGRIEDSVTRKVEGTGLGIGITIKLLELMDSVLELDSTYGVGSTFSFKLVQKIVDSKPLGDMENQAYAMMDNYEYAPGFMAPDANVLVVDDTDMNRMVFEGLLKPTGIKVFQADSGKTALECVKQEKYDVIFLDHMMPGMDGIEVVKRIKSDDSHKNTETPVIALTANAISGAREMYLEAGFDDYMTKPLVPEKLERLLETLIPQEKIIHDIDSRQIGNATVQSSDENGAANKSRVSSKINIEELPTIEGLDWNYCMTHLSGSAVMNTVRVFYNSIDGWLDEMNSYYDTLKKLSTDNKEPHTDSNKEHDTDMEETLDKYRILVHSIKGAATIIGLLPVAGMAAALEYAARDKVIERIMHVTPHFSVLLKEYKEKMSVIDDSAKTDKLDINDEDKKTIIEMLGFLIELVNEFDIHGADDLMERLKEYKFESRGEEIMAKLSGAVTNIDNEAVESLCNEMIALVEEY